MCDRAGDFTRGVVVLAVFVVVTLMATSVAAQSTTGTILGKVTDSGGLVLPGDIQRRQELLEFLGLVDLAVRAVDGNEFHGSGHI